MLYNKYCENIVLMSYPRNSGGKFIINNLGLSKHCFFQKLHLVKKQLSGRLSPDQKLSYLLYQLNDQTPFQWNDLRLGCMNLFGDPYDPENFSEEIVKITHQNLGLFFLVVHNLNQFDAYQKIWPCAKHIHITNASKFINWRLNLPEDFDKSKYPRLSQGFPQEHDHQLSKNATIWNSEWFFDWHVFCVEMKNLYNHLQLPDFNADLVKQYYQAYYDTLLRVRYVPPKI